MDQTYITHELAKNKSIFKELLMGLPKKEYLWRPHPDKWCLLEIICHLYDEEREDFRFRTRHTLENPGESLPSIDPEKWVLEREYIKKNFSGMLYKFLTEREVSIKWLRALRSPDWNKAYEHPKFGKMTAGMFLCNWLAHDYLHIRQIVRLKYYYLKGITGEDLGYAGTW